MHVLYSRNDVSLHTVPSQQGGSSQSSGESALTYTNHVHLLSSHNYMSYRPNPGLYCVYDMHRCVCVCVCVTV